MISSDYVKFLSRRWIAISFFLSLAVDASCQLPVSSSPKINIARTKSEIEDLKLGKYTGGQDVDELYKLTTASSHSRSHNVPPPAVNVDRSSTAADLMVSDSDSDNIIEEVIGSSKHDGSRRISSNLAAAVVAGICLLVAITSYAALMFWRNMTNARYANRAMLLTDDDMGDIQDEDLRHFEAACIQIEG